MSQKALLGIDLGTSSVKAVLTDLGGVIIGRTVADYPIVRAGPGWAETPPADWWTAVRASVRRVVADTDALVVGIGLSGQMHGLVVTDGSSVPLRPAMLWADTRAQAELDRYRALPQPMLADLANPLFPGMAGPMLLWLKENEPQVYAQIRWVLQPKDWIRQVLTGRVLAEPSDASATLLYDVVNGCWATEAMATLGLDPAVLPQLVPSSLEPAGTLTAAAASELGLKPGIPVAAGAGDTAAAAVGSGIVAPGAAQLTVGTGMQLIAARGEPPHPRLAPTTHHYQGALPRSWYEMAAVLNGGLALKWVIDMLRVTWDELYPCARADFDEDSPLFLPQLCGERTPYMDSTMAGGWIHLRSSNSRADLLRSALEGVAFAARAARAALDELLDSDGLAALRLAGGGTRTVEFRQLLADVLNVELQCTAVSDASGRGAAMLGGVAAGIFDADAMVAMLEPSGQMQTIRPRPEFTEKYDQRWKRYRDAVAALRRTEDGQV